ncbi:hypothetical protein Cgig2_029092 [Carnegiea gigantea]|uniref:Uncharacterized protein n=1 Tax=Carnegiea gigantea TaxID=171969 RepID=A0A9Q1KBI5_9CARY|nr:hypothetical protein Cgig2_029092 [Carnegiea gigantea]
MMIRERSGKAGGSPPPTPADLTPRKRRRKVVGQRSMRMRAVSNSIDAPPLPLIALFGIVLFTSTYPHICPSKKTYTAASLSSRPFSSSSSPPFYSSSANYTATEDAGVPQPGGGMTSCPKTRTGRPSCGGRGSGLVVGLNSLQSLIPANFKRSHESRCKYIYITNTDAETIVTESTTQFQLHTAMPRQPLGIKF